MDNTKAEQLTKESDLIPLLERLEINSSLINGQVVMSVNDFARVTRKSSLSIYKLISDGNRIRRLRMLKLASTILVPVTEILDFPFTSLTRGEIYKYDVNGVEHRHELPEDKATW